MLNSGRCSALTIETMTVEDARRMAERFIQDHIDSVPHLEALLLVWNSRPKRWTANDLAAGIFVDTGTSRRILHELARKELIAAESDAYFYDSQEDKDQVLGAVAETYRRELIRLTRMIHAKPPVSIREFARAFRFKKERD